MFETLLTLVPSICWILYRCFKILRTPVSELIEDLNIEIPHSPNICIDSITKNSAIIHWDIEIKADENLYYILMINNLEVATITSKSCKLNNLDPSQLYQIQIIAVNSLTNFRSQSSAVYIQPIEKEEGDSFGFEMGEMELEGEKTNTRAIDNKPSTKFDVDFITVDVVKSTTSSEVLNDYLIAFQNETIKLNSEYKNFQSRISKESLALEEQLKFYKQEYDAETDNKVKKDHDVKSLERKKDKLNYQKLKLTNQLNSLKASIELFHTKIEASKQKIQKLSDRNTQLLKGEAGEKDAIHREINEITSESEKIKKENDKIEEQMKQLLAEKKELNNILSQVEPLIDELNCPANVPGIAVNSASVSGPMNGEAPSSVFTKEGNINPKVFDTLNKIFKVVPSWEEEIMHEINTFQESELRWKEAFRAEIKKYVSIHQSLEIAKQNKDKTYQPIKLTEYQASIDFGGFSNALPKPRYASGSNGNKPTARSFSPSIEENNASFFNHYSSVYSNEDANHLDSINTQPIGMDAMVSAPFNTNGLSGAVMAPGIQATPMATSSSPGVQQSMLSTISSQPGVNSSTVSILAPESDNLQPMINQPLGQSMSSSMSQSMNPPLSAPMNPPLSGFPYDDSIYTSSLNSPIQETAPPLYSGYELNSSWYSPRLASSTLSAPPTSGVAAPGGQRSTGVWNTSGLGRNDLFAGNDSLTSLPADSGVYGVSAGGGGVGVNSGGVGAVAGPVSGGVSAGVGAGVNDPGYLVAPKLWNGGDLAPTGAGAGESTPNHGRSVSNSQIWRDNPNPSAHNFHLGMAEFQPFGSSLDVQAATGSSEQAKDSFYHQYEFGSFDNGSFDRFS